MAITKVYAVRHQLKRAISYAANEEKTALCNIIDYAANPSKTEQRLFESSINCMSVETAYNEMMETKHKFGKEGKVLAYHYIQSFAPGEVTPELAHKIGCEFAAECFGDRFEVVIGTHLDKNHLHNHVIVNSVSFTDGGKFRSTPKSYYNIIRKTSDRLCREYELSVIEQPKRRGKHYAEWSAERQGKPTIRGQMREELDEIIKQSYTISEFWTILKRRGYVISLHGENVLHTSIIPPYGKRAIRLDSLGDDYSEESIKERISAQRNGIVSVPPQRAKQFRYSGDIRKHKPKKLRGFQALYFHYLYFFNLIRRKRTPQRVSFFMRNEIIKFERYQKQMKFLRLNNIETAADLEEFRCRTEEKINDLIDERKNVYSERTPENETEIKSKAAEINRRLCLMRGDIRMCDKILSDSKHIADKQRQADEIIKQKEVVRNGYKRGSR